MGWRGGWRGERRGERERRYEESVITERWEGLSAQMEGLAPYHMQCSLLLCQVH